MVLINKSLGYTEENKKIPQSILKLEEEVGLFYESNKGERSIKTSEFLERFKEWNKDVEDWFITTKTTVDKELESYYKSDSLSFLNSANNSAKSLSSRERIGLMELEVFGNLISIENAQEESGNISFPRTSFDTGMNYGLLDINPNSNELIVY